jgi:TPR repeat protein
MLKLASIYEHGSDVAKDEAAAFAWYEKAANAGSEVGMERLGRIYKDGLLGQTTDAALSVDWYLKAARQGSKASQKYLGTALSLEDGRATEDEIHVWLSLAAEDPENTLAHSLLGRLYYSGIAKFQSYEKAKPWLEKAAAKGNADSLNLLGLMYYSGLGLQINYSKALSYFRRAAEKEFISGMENYALIVHQGLGMTKDEALAIKIWQGVVATFKDEWAIQKLTGIGAPAKSTEKFDVKEYFKNLL